MKTQLMQVDKTSGNRVYAEDIQYSTNVYSEIFRGGMGIIGSTNAGIFKLFGLAVNDTSVQITKGTLLIYYNGSNSATITDPDQIAVCRYNGNVVTINQGSSITLYVGYNETQRVNESGSNYIAYRDYFFQTTSFSGSKLTLSVPANLTIPELMKQYGWNYPMPKSFTFDLLEIPVDAEGILTEGSVGTGQLANYCVTSDRIANGAVGTDQLNVSEVNGMFFDYTISNISQFGTVFNNILSRGSYKVRILAGEYNITQSYNLGNTSSNNKVDIYCDPGVVLNGFLSTNVLSNFIVTRDSGSGGVTLHGGKINAIYQSGETTNPHSAISGFSGIYDSILCLPLNPTTTQTSTICISNSCNINNITIDLISTSYSSTQPGKAGVIFRECNNISNIFISKPQVSSNNPPYIRIFDTCNNISNVKINTTPVNKYITFFMLCKNVSKVDISISGQFPVSTTRWIYVFQTTNNISDFNISVDNYGYDPINNETIYLVYLCKNISSGTIKLNNTSSSYLTPMLKVIYECMFVQNMYILGDTPLITYIENSHGVTNNVLYSANGVVEADVYLNSYASSDNSAKCGNTALGGFNYSIEGLP
jgi:hypothetical protein